MAKNEVKGGGPDIYSIASHSDHGCEGETDGEYAEAGVGLSEGSVRLDQHELMGELDGNSEACDERDKSCGVDQSVTE
eukprot:10922219-Alexandrium_andersonii.AAC.1